MPAHRSALRPTALRRLACSASRRGIPPGGELNGQTTAHDLGMGKMLSTKKDFIGRFMAARPALTDPARATLVGLKPVEPGARIRAGAHLLPQGAEATAANDQGYVTSIAFSPSLGHWLGLGSARARARASRRDRARLRSGARRRPARRGASGPASSIRKGRVSVSSPLQAKVGACRHRRPRPLWPEAMASPVSSSASGSGSASPPSPRARARPRP